MFWPSRAQFLSNFMKKGLSNQGENHCFLNVVIQTLWHLDYFRQAFKSVTHTCNLETCILCSLREIFINYESSENSCIPPSELRKALSESFQGQFDVGQMADAAEALTSIIEVLQKHDQNIGNVFMQQISSYIECTTCNHASKIESSDGYCLLFYIGSLKESHAQQGDSFSQIIHKTLQLDQRLCPRQGVECPRSNNYIPISRFIGPDYPTVFPISLIWTERTPEYSDLELVVNLISVRINLNQIFTQCLMPEGMKYDLEYNFKGVVCFRNYHYVTYIWQPEDGAWFMFNDSDVREVGKTFRDVKFDCLDREFIPVLLIYEYVTAQNQYSPYFYQPQEHDMDYIKLDKSWTSWWGNSNNVVDPLQDEENSIFQPLYKLRNYLAPQARDNRFFDPENQDDDAMQIDRDNTMNNPQYNDNNNNSNENNNSNSNSNYRRHNGPYTNRYSKKNTIPFSFSQDTSQGDNNKNENNQYNDSFRYRSNNDKQEPNSNDNNNNNNDNNDNNDNNNDNNNYNNQLPSETKFSEEPFLGTPKSTRPKESPLFTLFLVFYYLCVLCITTLWSIFIKFVPVSFSMKQIDNFMQRFFVLVIFILSKIPIISSLFNVVKLRTMPPTSKKQEAKVADQKQVNEAKPPKINNSKPLHSKNSKVVEFTFAPNPEKDPIFKPRHIAELNED